MLAVRAEQLGSLHETVLELGRQADRDETLRLVAARAVDVVPGCQMAGISMRTSQRRPSEVETTAFTSSLALQADSTARSAI